MGYKSLTTATPSLSWHYLKLRLVRDRLNTVATMSGTSDLKRHYWFCKHYCRHVNAIQCYFHNSIIVLISVFASDSISNETKGTYIMTHTVHTSCTEALFVCSIRGGKCVVCTDGGNLWPCIHKTP